jgi:hypothetical protein
MTERLRKCIDAGDVLALFPLLKDWPDDELVALVADVEAIGQEAESVIDANYRTEAMRVENFFSRERSAAVDQAHRDARMQVFAMASEIISVALYYLGERGVETGD